MKDMRSYGICPKFTGRGMATSAVKLVLCFLGGHFVATAHPNNLASHRVLEKLGFKLDSNRVNVPKYGQRI